MIIVFTFKPPPPETFYAFDTREKSSVWSIFFLHTSLLIAIDTLDELNRHPADSSRLATQTLVEPLPFHD